jgi:hypothetical protein
VLINFDDEIRITISDTDLPAAHHAGFVRVDHGLHPVAQAELHQHPTDVGLHRGLAACTARRALRRCFGLPLAL